MRLRGALFALVLLLTGCANFWSWGPDAERHSAPIPEPIPERPVGPGEYAVHQGDTMYSIAFRNQVDYRQLAKWNGIGTDYLIHPGQVLRLTSPGVPAIVNGNIMSRSAEPGEAPSAKPIPLPPTLPPRPPGPALPRPSAPGAMAGAPPLPVPSAMSPAPIPPRIPPVQPVAPVVAAVEPPTPLTSESGGPYQWQWPTDGIVVRGFNPQTGSKGLDFSGDLGQAVVAAAPGKVVYSGAALKGYGELIIIKHDDLRLSAYAYNRTRLVEDGDMVRGGQKIAELGLGPESKPILHFEIRERGQPVNPATYLPAKR